jgi:NitT/TauT family transport system permease protein
MKRILHNLLPALTLLTFLLLWELGVRWANIPAYTLPSPSVIAMSLIDHWPSLALSWWFTIKITLGALILACLGGVLIASVFSLSPQIERAFFPIAVVLQVTPIVAIAPLMLIYIESTTVALLLCAWIVAFFPILSNTVTGLRATDRNLVELFRLYRASPWQRLVLLRAPAAL